MYIQIQTAGILAFFKTTELSWERSVSFLGGHFAAKRMIPFAFFMLVDFSFGKGELWSLYDLRPLRIFILLQFFFLKKEYFSTFNVSSNTGLKFMSFSDFEFQRSA
jgi:hypothetical protein